jgi:WD40 repeat protein
MLTRSFLAAVVCALPLGARADNPKPERTFTTAGEVKWLAFAPDGKALLTASERAPNGNTYELRLWDVASGKLLAGPVASDHVSASGAISPDGKTAVTGSYDGTWQLWSLPDLKAGANGRVGYGRVHRIGFAPDGQSFAALLADYRKKLTDPFKANRVTYTAFAFTTKSGKALGQPQNWPREVWKNEEPTAPRTSDPAGWSVGMTPDFGKDGRPVPPAGAQTVALTVPNDDANCGGPVACAISPNRKWAVSGGCNGTVVFWDYQTGKPLGDPLPKVGNARIQHDALLFTPKSDRVAVVRTAGGLGGPYLPVVTVYNAESRKAASEPLALGELAWLRAIALTPDGNAVAVACQTRGADGEVANEVRLWKLVPTK